MEPEAPEQQPLDDVTLAERCARGDAAAQHTFFERTRVQTHRTLFRVLGSNQHMEDLLQETFIEAFRSLHAFRGDASLATWVDTIAVRVVYRHLSKRRREALPLTAADELRATPGDAERQLDARNAVRQLYAMLDRIEPIYRIAYNLHVIDGRPLQEVAQVTGSTVMAVKNRVWRARRMVQARAERDPVLRDFVTSWRTVP
jgi:RNA polymerase sigma-70 factor, ECF subfamily